ncbi:hypothetical protein Pfo_026070 [Paulownia fortunei]|nr:hypothetical protein Pfo_026070 [Paulownia fortunei]
MDAWAYFFSTPDDLSELLASVEDETAESDSQKSECSEPQDRLSELPDSLILLILSFLPMRYVVRTTLLSKRWKDLWTTVPCLDFSDEENDLDRFQNFVNRALILWKGTKILKCNIDFSFGPSLNSDLDLWVRVAIENEVEELSISLQCEGDTGYWAPQRLYSCSSIRKLSLLGCNLKIHGNLHWNQLKSLKIDGVCLSQHVIDQVLSSTPQLEVLFLCPMESNENLNIQSSSLKRLTIEKFLDLGDEEAMDTVLTIWAPNVETLEITGVWYSKCLLMDVSSLTDAAFGFSLPIRNAGFSCYRLHGELLRQIFQSIHHLEKVTLWDLCIKALGVMEKKDFLSPLLDVKFLKLYPKDSEVEEIVDLLEIVPKLEMLVLEQMHHHWIMSEDRHIGSPVVLEFNAENPLKSKTNFPKSFLLHLRTVEITWSVYDTSIFPFIELLLKHASMLEKMVIRVRRIMSLAPESLFLAAQKLMRMPRSSPTAEVILSK